MNGGCRVEQAESSCHSGAHRRNVERGPPCSLQHMDVDEAMVVGRQALLVRGATELTNAARIGGTTGVITRLSQLLNGWAILIDRYGNPVASVGASRIHVDDAVAAALRLSRRIRVSNLGVYPVGHALDAKASLVVSDRLGDQSLVRGLAALAAALLDLTFSPVTGTRLDAVARADAVDVLLATDAALCRRVAGRWGLIGDRLGVAVVRSQSRSVVLESKVIAWLEELDLSACAVSRGSTVIAIIEPHATDAWAQRVQRAADDGIPVRCGIGELASPGSLGASMVQAEQALEIALADSRPVVRFSELNLGELLLRYLPAITLSALSQPIVELDAVDPSGELTNSLRVFLAENGSWEAASVQLGVHRHTLKSRIQKVEDVTGYSMTNAEDRAQLWLAIRARSVA